MKKITLLIVLLTTFISNAQEETNNSKVNFVNTFQFTFGFSNLIPNESMMGESHKSAFPSFSARLGIFSYDKFTVGIHAGLYRMEVKDNQYYGFFNKTTAFVPGFYLSYFQPISNESILEPYLTYDYTKYTSTGYNDKELDSESDGLGLGIDYQHKIGGRAYITLGLKYSFNKMRTETNENWEKYINNYNYMSAKIGFTFSKNRL